MSREKNIYRPAPPRLIQVKSFTDVTPHLRRITFTADSLDTYPADCEGAHLKLFIAKDAPNPPALPVLSDKGPVWPEDKPRPVARTYTVRAVRPERKEIDIEFAMHDDAGPAVDFARNAKPGDYIGITNPGGPDPLLPVAKYYYMAADLTALPAVSALLEKMPAEAQGNVVIRIDHTDDQQMLNKPAGINLHWITGGTEKTAEITALFKSWPVADVTECTFWIAGEDAMVRDLRRYVRRELNGEHSQMYAIPYWRFGYDEEGYHRQRHDVMDADD